MKNTILNKWSSAFFFSILILVSSCSLDDSVQAPDLSSGTETILKPNMKVPNDYIPGNTNARKNWMPGEGWAKAYNIDLTVESGENIDPQTETHSYNATLKAGEISGTFEVVNYDMEGELLASAKGEVLCMVFEEDCKTVRMTGVITEASTESLVGRYAIWLAEDNGNGLDATTDIRYNQPKSSADYHCEIGFTPAQFGQGLFFEEIEGNVKVKSMDCYGDVTGDNGK
ncbi:hypothetical protein [Algoriphagus sp.]|uniref:hypothetical protein n=1 Tax=Algoriphagus sp. TaxID=1872435 RepID=UPI0025EE0D04|nr:hypothetical protein [Algoriphagus sp.]